MTKKAFSRIVTCLASDGRDTETGPLKMTKVAEYICMGVGGPYDMLAPTHIGI